MKPQAVIGKNITAAFGVVAFSIFLQRGTMTPLLRGLKVLSSSPTGPDPQHSNFKKKLEKKSKLFH